MINKEKILKDLKADVSSADTLRIETVGKVESWKAQYDGKPYGNEGKNKSQLVSRDIRRQDEWQHASVKDPFLSSSDIIKASPVTFEDKSSADQNNLLLNYQFTRQFNRYNFITDTVKLLSKEGTAVIKTSWMYEDEEIEVDYPVYDIDIVSGEPVQVGIKPVKQINVITNKPHAEVCRIEDVYIDPTCMGDIEKAQFFCHRYETDVSTLRKSKKYKKEVINKLAKNIARDTGDYQNEDDSNFEFSDVARKKLIVYEYWGNYDIREEGIAIPIVCEWVGDTLIRLEDNPYPDKKAPFVIAANGRIPFYIMGEGNAEVIGDNQKIATAIKRGFIDSMASSTNGQKGISKRALDGRNRLRFLAGKNFEMNTGPQDIFEGSYNQIPTSAFQVLELINNSSESMLGVKSFSEGIEGQGLGSTARAAGGVLDAISIRKLDIVRNISENIIKPLMRKWIAYNSEFLRDEEVIRVTNEEFVTIRRDDLSGDIDIDIDISTAEDNSAKAQQLSFELQTNGPNMEPEMRNLLLAEKFKLNKMPELAKMIKDFKPEPDPIQQRIAQLQIEKLEAEILERKTRAEENIVDMRLKSAKAALEEARAKNVNSDTDAKDLDFLKKATGADLEDELAKKDHDRGTQLDLKSIDSLQSNNNIV